jgi:tetratricopeptide (TPR) repeat protein
MKRPKSLVPIVILIVLSMSLPLISFAQKTYIGDPVTKDGLIKALKMRQFKTSDIVSIINEQGCEFRLTSDVQEDLRKAGARPEVIEAVRRNYRGALKVKTSNPNSKTYEGLISQAINVYESERNAKEAIGILNQAIALEPNKYRAYQMLGYVTLYGQRNFKQAEEYMRKAIDLGGSAVFRLRHGHDYTLSYSCSGSFYISRGNVRYESDENVHTFQVKDSDIVKIETGNKWAGLFKFKGGIFNIVIRDKVEKDKDLYQFSPLTGKGDEAKMIIRLVGKN